MGYILPKPLKQGDTIGIIAPSGAVRNAEQVKLGVERLQNLGFRIKLSEHLYDKENYLAGGDSVRAEEINRFFADGEVDCIMCARGGFGALRIIDFIDYDLIKNNPKIFCGYSDISALSAMLLKKAGLITYSAPMLCGDFGKETISDFTINEFFKTICGNPCEYELTTAFSEYVCGISWGGNLTTIASLCGREFLPQKDFIFIIEDINEPVYKLDRCLAQLCALKEFREYVRGVVCGDFDGVDNSVWLEELFKEYSKKLDIPFLTGLKLGHGSEKITFPIGGECEVFKNKIFFK